MAIIDTALVVKMVTIAPVGKSFLRLDTVSGVGGCI